MKQKRVCKVYEGYAKKWRMTMIKVGVQVGI